MSEFDQIEQVLRRYDYRCDSGPNDTERRNLKAWRLSWVDRAITVLEGVGYRITERHSALMCNPPIPQTHYYVEIDGRTIYPDADYATLLGFAHDLCNDYRDRDMAALVEYVKSQHSAVSIDVDSAQIADWLARTANENAKQIDDMAAKLRASGVPCSSISDGIAEEFNKTAAAGARAGKAFRDALLSVQSERDLQEWRNLDDGWGCESAWPDVNIVYDHSNISNRKLKHDWIDKGDNCRWCPSCFTMQNGEHFIAGFDANNDNICPGKQKESTSMCDCGERLESLSERVERLESAAKSKDVDSDGTPYGLPQGKPYWAIKPDWTYTPSVTTGSGNVTISGDGFRVMDTSSGITITPEMYDAMHKDGAISYTTVSDWNTAEWHTGVGTGKVLIERDVIVAEIERRANQWTLQADHAASAGKLHRARRYRNNANVLACLAGDIESGAYDNE